MIDELRAEIAEVMLRRTLSEVHKDLPEARSVMRAIPLTPDLYVEYRNLRRLVKTWQDVEMFDTTVEISSQTQVIHLLRTFLNNPLSRGVRSNPKLDELSRILEEVDGSILVFTWHKEYTEWLANTIPGAEFIHGGVPGPQRADRLNRLRDGSLRILVATMSSIGVGVDLPTVDAVVFMETDWTPAVIEQAWRRIYRVTSSGLKLVYFVFFKSTIEELIVRAFSEKAQLSEELITQAIFKEIT
jgi:SNF2 family DNA or RNA helicase